MILKPDVTSDEVRIYEAYLQRMQKEYDLIWSRFKIYFGFNSGLIVIIGYILRPYFTENCFTPPDCILWWILLLGFIGLVFSIVWLSINVNGKKWQDFFNDKLSKIEDILFENKDLALHKEIIRTARTKVSFFDVDVVSINITLSYVFIVIWLFIIIIPSVILLK